MDIPGRIGRELRLGVEGRGNIPNSNKVIRISMMCAGKTICVIFL